MIVPSPIVARVKSVVLALATVAVAGENDWSDTLVTRRLVPPCSKYFSAVNAVKCE